MNPESLNPQPTGPLPTRWIRMAVIALVVIALDQATKAMARAWLPRRRISLLGDLVRLQPSQNTGAFLGLGANLPEAVRFWIFIVASTGMLIALGVYTARDPALNRTAVTALSLVLGGGIGNLIDRIRFNGRVFDFLNVGIGPVRTGIFNIADVAITFGALLAVWASWHGAPRDQP